MIDERLRSIYAARVASTAPANRSNCPTPEQLAEIARGARGDGSARLALLDHVFACAECRPEFELLRAVESSADEEPVVSVARANAARVWFTGPRIAAAAALLVAVGIGGYSLRGALDSVEANTVRGGAADSSDVVVVSPTPATASAQFVWRKVPGAVTYEVQVLDTTGSVLLSSVGSDTVYMPTEAERLRLQAAGTVDWFVAAKRADGNERRSSIARVLLIVNERR